MNKFYKIVVSAGAHDVAELVNKHIADGWRLYGYPYTGNGAHFQAMISNEYLVISTQDAINLSSKLSSSMNTEL